MPLDGTPPRAPGLTLVYGLKTDDASYLASFYPSRRLAEASLGLDYHACVLPPWGDPHAVANANAGRVVLARGELDESALSALSEMAAVLVNGIQPTMLARDKWAAAAFFRSIGAAHPDTRLVPAGLREAPLPYPFVAKPRYGKMGRGVALVDSAEAWSAYLDAAGGSDLVCQEAVASSFGRDLRFFFADFVEPRDAGWGPVPHPRRPDLASVCVARTGPGFLSNAHAGGTMSKAEPTADLLAEAERIYDASGLDYGTVDFLYGGGGSFVACELNSCPGFEELERATGLDAAGAILRTAARTGRERTAGHALR